LAESRVDRFGERQRLGRSTVDHSPLSGRRLHDVLGESIVFWFGLLETGRAFADSILGHILGSGEYVTNVEVHRRKDSLGEAFLAAAPLVAAAKRGRQQQESEEL
jgi:hypothetical protein